MQNNNARVSRIRAFMALCDSVIELKVALLELEGVKLRKFTTDGGEGSGYFDHEGRPGEVGGSAPDSAGGGSSSGRKELSIKDVGKLTKENANEFSYKGMDVKYNSGLEKDAQTAGSTIEIGDRFFEWSEKSRHATLARRYAEVETSEIDKTAEWSPGAKKMLGDFVLGKEYESTDKPNKYPVDNSKWGTEPGEYTVYRAGGDDPGIMFCGSEFRDANNYAQTPWSINDGESKSQEYIKERIAVRSYTVDVKKPFVSENMRDAYKELFGKEVSLDPNNAQRKKGIAVGDLWVAADRKIAAALKKKGYDAWTQTKPAPPAKKEMVVLNPKAAVETGRKIPNYIRESVEEAVRDNDAWAYMYQDGKAVHSLKEWWETDRYKEIQAQKSKGKNSPGG